MKPHIKLVPEEPGVFRSVWKCSQPGTCDGWGSTAKTAFEHWVSNNNKLRIARDSSKEIRGADR